MTTVYKESALFKMDERERKAAIYCEVCMDQFSHEEGYIPRILHCGHTYCERCLKKISRKKYKLQGMRKISCPRCKAETDLGLSNPSEKLPKNFSYLDLIGDVLEIQRNQVDKCKEHPDYVLDMFCHGEEEAVCLNCIVYGDHKTHKVSKLSGFSDHQKTTIEYNKSCLETMIKDCENLEELLKIRRSDIDEKVNNVRHCISTRVFFIQEKIKKCLDAKLEMVLKELDEMHAVQSALLDENFDIGLDTEELEALKDKSESFLSTASKIDIAKEKGLINDVGKCLQKVSNRELTTQHVYEVRIDDSDQIVEIVEDLVDAWVCRVYETKPATRESINTILEKYSNCFSKSLAVLFGEEKLNDQLCQNPFEDIDCERYNGNQGYPADTVKCAVLDDSDCYQEN